MQKHLKGQHYPAKKADLVKTARSNHASQEILDWIQDLPQDEFHGPQDAMKAFGEEDHQKEADSAGE